MQHIFLFYCSPFRLFLTTIFCLPSFSGHWLLIAFARFSSRLIFRRVACESDLLDAQSVSSAVRKDLISAGVVPDSQKFVWVTVQIAEWLSILCEFIIKSRPFLIFSSVFG